MMWLLPNGARRGLLVGAAVVQLAQALRPVVDGPVPDFAWVAQWPQWPQGSSVLRALQSTTPPLPSPFYPTPSICFEHNVLRHVQHGQ